MPAVHLTKAFDNSLFGDVDGGGDEGDGGDGGDGSDDSGGGGSGSDDDSGSNDDSVDDESTWSSGGQQCRRLDGRCGR